MREAVGVGVRRLGVTIGRRSYWRSYCLQRWDMGEQCVPEHQVLCSGQDLFAVVACFKTAPDVGLPRWLVMDLSVVTEHQLFEVAERSKFIFFRPFPSQVSLLDLSTMLFFRCSVVGRHADSFHLKVLQIFRGLCIKEIRMAASTAFQLQLWERR
jgi:hypothetical protein